MSRKGCPNKVQSGITYPRKCEHCDYMSNNPSMYHYHKKTHEAIPEGKLCDGGCGQLATVINTHGKYTCLPVAQHCPEYLRLHSERITKQWDDPKFDDRRLATRERFFKYCCGNEDALAKMRATKKSKYGTLQPSELKSYRSYSRWIRTRAQRWAKDLGYELGVLTFHVDHKLSIKDGWRANLPAEIVNHPANLQVIEAKKNSGKGAKSSLTVEELLKLIEESKK